MSPNTSARRVGDGGPAASARNPNALVPRIAGRSSRTGRSRRGGLMTRDSGSVQKESWRVRRALSAAQCPAARPLGVTRRPASLELTGRRAPFRPPSRRLSPLAARRFPRARRASCLPTCPRLCGARNSALPAPDAHTPRLQPPPPAPHPSPPAVPRSPESTAERTAPTTATAARRSLPARATSSGRLATFPNSTTAARRRRHCGSLGAYHPPQTPDTNRGSKTLSSPARPPTPRSPSHTRD